MTEKPQVETSQKPGNTNQGLTGCLTLFAICSVLMAVFFSCSTDDPYRIGATAGTSYVPAVGEVVRLRSPSTGQVPVAVDEQAYEALLSASVANDLDGINELIIAGKVFIVESGTQVRVLDLGFTRSKVRITDGPHAGRVGWVATDWITR
ncbi:MAG: hypothetical protein DIU70_003685 [Bacillota bacterium]|nr:MAG: hypothetical protein DIU70_00805 [Bacillota bacterium]